ncbi:MAG: flotillin family protein [Proteobacteria bacterium]|nr:flotillin family protein [Pseudomonadota bacterium]NIS70097.1 flotillin family protein [Pseudomonadota bacterium]
MTTFSIILTCIIIGLAALPGIWLLMWWLYHRASKEIAFVRTGFGGQKVVKDGGALVLPVLHEIIPVNMNTLRLEVIRSNNQALITRDRMRVDVQAEFYVRVKPMVEAIADAAQTLGRRTMDPKALKELVEGRFVYALRAVAAEMAMEELHEKRTDFVRAVGVAVSEDLLRNGLELESLSLTALDQTDQSYFNPQNAFDAQGLAALTQVIQGRMKQRNEIERETEVAIRRKNLEAERQKLELSKEEEFARLEQQREIEVRRAEQQSNIAREQVEREREAKEAEIAVKKQVDQAQILAERVVEEERIAKDLLLREKDISSKSKIEIAEIAKERQAKEAEITAKKQVDQAQISAERVVEEERIAKDLLVKEKEIARMTAIETAEIERQMTVALSDQDRIIAIANKTKEESGAQAEAEKVRALAAKAEEEVTTARQIEIAERQKAIELVEARKKAEREAIAVIEAAEARKKAAIGQAEAVRIIADGEAEKVKIAAQAEAEAEITRVQTAEKRYSVDATGIRALHEAENILDPGKSASRIKMAIIEHLGEIIRESVKPMEKIEGIKILHVDGLGFGARDDVEARGRKDSSAGPSGNLADQLVNSALRYRSQAPLVDAILREIGIKGGDINGLTAAIKPDSEIEPKGETKKKAKASMK